MRYVLFNWVHPDDAAAWETMTPQQQEVEVERVRAWFRKYADQIKGGEELDWPHRIKALRPGRQGEGVVVTDGPYVETKEILGGFVIFEADTEAEALQMASEWPSLTLQAKATVHLQPVFVRG
jgi:hypothetical protein